MSRAGTLRAVATIERPRLWGLGLYETADGALDMPLSWHDIERDTAWAALALRALGVTGGGPVVVVSGAWEAPWFGPLRRALRAAGTAYAPCEIWGWDLTRIDLFVRRLGAASVIGVTAEQAAALGARSDIAERLAAVPRVIARADAAASLQQHGISAPPLALLGPATGLPCGRGGAVHVNGHEWAVTEVAGRLAITTVGPREHQVVNVVLSTNGVVVEDPCGCGVPGPRIVV